MTQTAPRAILLENYNERSRVRAVLVEVRGPTETPTAPQNGCYPGKLSNAVNPFTPLYSV